MENVKNVKKKKCLKIKLHYVILAIERSLKEKINANNANTN